MLRQWVFSLISQFISLIIWTLFHSWNSSDEVTKCGALVTLNNTYWQAPAAVSSESTCGLTVKMDRTLIEQRATTCQLRYNYWRIESILHVYLFDFLFCSLTDLISFPSRFHNPMFSLFVALTVSKWPAHSTKCQSFAETTTANTVRQFQIISPWFNLFWILLFAKCFYHFRTLPPVFNWFSLSVLQPFHAIGGSKLLCFPVVPTTLVFIHLT